MPDNDDGQKLVRTAVRRSAMNWPVIVTIVCFSAVLCFMAKDLTDGSEARTIIITVAVDFFTLVIGYLLTGQRSGR